MTFPAPANSRRFWGNLFDRTRSSAGRFPPEPDERLSSWLARLATFYAMTVSEFVAELGLAGCDIFDLEWHLSEGEGALIAARTGVPEVALQAMTYSEFVPDARIMIARKSRHCCPDCPADVRIPGSSGQ